MEIRGRVTAFLKAVYSDMSCEVKVGEKCSEPFGVLCSLRRVYSLAPAVLAICELSSVQIERSRGWGEMWKPGNSSVIVCR